MAVPERGFKDCSGVALVGRMERRKPRALKIMHLIVADEDGGIESS